MKDRVRESVFNLIGPQVEGCCAIDLFAGTGVLGLEAVSRGATRAILIERHFPTARRIREHAEQLEVAQQVEVVGSDTFVWVKRQTQFGPERCLVFCSPPYSLYLDHWEEMASLLQKLISQLPAHSLIVVEADERFDLQRLPLAADWQTRSYPPAQIAILRLGDRSASDQPSQR